MYQWRSSRDDLQLVVQEKGSFLAIDGCRLFLALLRHVPCRILLLVEAIHYQTFTTRGFQSLGTVGGRSYILHIGPHCRPTCRAHRWWHQIWCPNSQISGPAGFRGVSNLHPPHESWTTWTFKLAMALFSSSDNKNSFWKASAAPLLLLQVSKNPWKLPDSLHQKAWTIPLPIPLVPPSQWRLLFLLFCYNPLV